MIRMLIRLLKRVFVIVPVLLLTVMGVLIALLLWLLFGAGSSEFEFPHEIWIGRMMDWVDK